MTSVRLNSLCLLGALMLLLTFCACGGGSSSVQSGVLVSITGVMVGGSSSVVNVGQIVSLFPNVQGTGNYNNAVTWSVNGIPGGDAVNGIINGGGYVAPSAIPPTNPVTITATSVQDPTKSGSITVSVFTISISPPAPSLLFDQTQQFTAIVAGVSNASAQWQIFADLSGTVDANGLYTAPDPFSIQDMGQPITVALHANLTNAVGGGAVATITLKFPPPAVNSITPNGASANEGITISGQNFYEPSAILFPGPNGTMLRTNIEQTASTLTQIPAVVPLGATSGQVVVQFSQEGSTISVPTPFVRVPNVRIRAPQKDLSSGETLQFQSVLLGGSSPNTVNWTADMGNISSTGLYQAPTVSQETFATVTGCLAGTRSCDATLLRVVPVRISPVFPVTSLGQSLQLDAIAGSPTSANWSLLAGGSSVSSTGLFTAPTNPLQAGGEPVLASNGSASELASVAVRGAWPGIVSRTYDYMDVAFDQQAQLTKQKFEGTLFDKMAVNGNRAYTIGVGQRTNPNFLSPANPSFAAVEAYDITDPINPVWLGASESLSDSPAMLSTWSHYLYEVDTDNAEGSFSNEANRVMLYDTQSVPPKIIDFTYTPELSWVLDNNGVIYASPVVPFATPAPFPIYAFDITTGAIQLRQFNVMPPAAATPGTPPVAVIGKGNIVYCLYSESNQAALIATYDVSVSPPNLLGTTLFGPEPFNTSPFIIGPTPAFIRGNLLFWINQIFDISNAVPVQLSTVPTQLIADVQGNMLLGYGFIQDLQPATPDYLVRVDITNPANPTLMSTTSRSGDGLLLGNSGLMLSDDGLGGIATYDISVSGGTVDKSRTSCFPGGIVFDHAISQQTMYVAGASALGVGGLLTFDLSSGTPVWTGGSLLYGNYEATSLQLSGNTLFMGLFSGLSPGALKTVDISNPANPVETGSVTLPTSALVLSGNILFDGTTDGRLVTLNVANANSPTIVSTVPLPSSAINLRIVGTTLFVADESSGLLIFDVSNPASPVQLSQFTVSTPIWDVTVSGNLAFLAADSTGLVILDISNLMQPKQVSQTLLVLGTALSTKVNNGLVYVGTANAGGLVFAFDYGQPTFPRLVSMGYFGEDGDSLVTGMTLSGTDIFVVGEMGVDDGVVQSDASAPRNVIDLYYPPLTLQNASSGSIFSAKVGSPVHPKFNRQLLNGKHHSFTNYYVPDRRPRNASSAPQKH